MRRKHRLRRKTAPVAAEGTFGYLSCQRNKLKTERIAAAQNEYEIILMNSPIALLRFR